MQFLRRKDLVALAKERGFEVEEDALQPGRWIWRRADGGDASVTSFDSIEQVLQNIEEECGIDLRRFEGNDVPAIESFVMKIDAYFPEKKQGYVSKMLRQAATRILFGQKIEGETRFDAVDRSGEPMIVVRPG